MFLAQIHSVEEEISQLQAQLRDAQERMERYRNLRDEAENALAMLKRIHEQASAIGEEKCWHNAVLHALQLTPQPPTPHPPTTPTEADVEPEPDAEEDEPVEDKSAFDDNYSTPDQLAAALEEDDPETTLLRIANVLDAAPAVEIEDRVRFFVQHLPMELCDRILNYLPKSIIPTWRSQVAARKLETEEQEARTSIFPAEAPTAYEYEPEKGDIVECKNNGLVGRVTYICDSPNGRMASVLLPGGTSNFHISNLRFIGKGEEETSAPEALQEGAPISDEIDRLAKQCLGLRSWSQMRIFADCNPDVITRMQELASSKSEKRIINNLPSLIVGYIQRANDRSDLSWLPDQLLSEVETLMQQAA
jgi:hypothetical protein